MAIDRKTLAEVILKGTAIPATQLYGIGSASFDPDLPCSRNTIRKKRRRSWARPTTPTGSNSS